MEPKTNSYQNKKDEEAMISASQIKKLKLKIKMVEVNLNKHVKYSTHVIKLR